MRTPSQLFGYGLDLDFPKKNTAVLKRKPLNLLAEYITFVGLYYILARLGLSLATFNSSTSPVWPATGLAIAYLVRRGAAHAPLVALAAAAANFATGASLTTTLGIAVGNALEAWAGRTIYLKALRRREFGYQGEVAALFITAILAPLASATCGTLSLWLTVTLSPSALGTTWLTWWVGDSLGALTVLPVFLKLSARNFRLTRAHLRPALLAAALIAAGSPLLLGPLPAPAHFAAFLLLLLGVHALGAESAKFLSLGFSAVAIWGTVHGKGPFQLGTLNQNLIHLQLFLATFAITAATLAGFRRAGSLRMASFMLVAGWTLSAGLFTSFRRTEAARDQSQLGVLAHDAESALRLRMNSYVDSLRGAVSLLTTTRVAHDEWRHYVTNLQISDRYAGLRGLGIIYPVPRDNIPAFERVHSREKGRPFQVHPVTDHAISADTAFVITHVEPFNLNQKGEGLDIGSEPLRRETADRARDEGVPAISGTISLMQDTQRRPGMLLLMPFYETGVPPSTVSERRERHLGWVYAPIVVEDFMWKAYDFNSGLINLAVYGGAISNENLVFRSSASEAPYEFETLLKLQNREFHVQWRRGPRFVSTHDATSSWIGVGGSLVTLLFAIMLFNLQNMGARARALADRQTLLLRESRERFELAVQGSSDGIWDWNLITNEVFFSDRLRSQLGYVEDELPAKRGALESIVLPEDLVALREAAEAHIKHHLPYHQEFRVRTKSGEVRWMLARGQAIWDAQGQPTRMAGSHTDITEQKERHAELVRTKEAALAATAAKSQFLANMSHEVRTPAAGVVGIANLLLDTPLTPEQRQYAEAIQRSGDSLLSVLSDILDFSKIEAGKLDIERAPFDLGQLIADVEASARILAAKRGLEFRLDLGPGLPTQVVGDLGRIRQVVTNLLSNAVKFTPQGYVRLGVFYSDDLSLRFVVEDSGLGISTDAQGRLFQAFTQADSSTSRKFGGSGLGLSICKRLVELMKGRIGLQSAVGHGSTFWFSVPVQAVQTKTAAPAAESCPVNFAKLRVLIAEDNPVNQMVTVQNLKKLGCKPHVVNDGEYALRALEGATYDVVLMDLQMPRVDGYEATRRIRRHESPRISKLPIIAVTANALQSDREECLRIGMNDYITKPLRMPELIAAISRCVPALPMDGAAIVPEGDDPDLFTDLAEIFLRETPASIARMRESLQSRDPKSLRLEAHSLKSGSAYLNLQSLREVAQELEEAKDDAEMDFYANMVEKIASLYELARVDLEKILAQASAKRAA